MRLASRRRERPAGLAGRLCPNRLVRCWTRRSHQRDADDSDRDGRAPRTSAFECATRWHHGSETAPYCLTWHSFRAPANVIIKTQVSLLQSLSLYPPPMALALLTLLPLDNLI